MAHLIYDGEWNTVDEPWSDHCGLTGTKEPEVGDTFSDFTSRNNAHQDLARRGLRVKPLRRAIWGEGDYRIIK
jgi:hypothetical protein